MPSGDAAYERKRQQRESARAAYNFDGPKIDYFALAANTYADVRFLEEGDQLTFADVHRVPLISKAGKRYFRDFVCLNVNGDGTACPACQSQDPEVQKIVTRGFLNLIWREGPVYERDDNGNPVKDGTKLRVVGRQDGVFLWKCSWTVFEDLKQKDRQAHGLMSRDWRISRTGSTMNDTKYHVEPVDFDAGPQQMTIADLALAEKKYSLAELTAPPTFEALASVLDRGALPPGQGAPQPTFDRGAGSGFQPAGGSPDQPQSRASAFTRG